MTARDRERVIPSPSRTILLAAGDPGGASAILPAGRALAERGAPLLILDHGYLGRNAPPDLCRVAPPAEGEVLADWLERWGISLVCFGTSLADHLPLALARAGRAQGLPVVCVLDNWMNYRARLAMDGGPELIPDCYAVMDDKARSEAMAEQVPEACLRVTGHPGLANLAEEIAAADPAWRREMRDRIGLGRNGRALVAFINEPAARDQGVSAQSPAWRGYTEREVLPLLCRELQSEAGRLDLVVVPHPRDDVAELETLWQGCRGRLQGGLAPGGLSGRQLVLAADRVAGMASILLYESWLQGKPTLSLQPGLVRRDLGSVATRSGIVFIDQAETASEGIGRWLRTEPQGLRPDLDRHRQAPTVLADLLQQIAGAVAGAP